MDQLFAQAVREIDEAKSAELGNQIDQQLTADMATIPLYAKPIYLAVRNTFANVVDNATQEGPSWKSNLWPRGDPAGTPRRRPGPRLAPRVDPELEERT